MAKICDAQKFQLRQMFRGFKKMRVTGPTWNARINISEGEMCPPVVVCKKKPYIKTMRQENDPTIKDYVVVERQRLPEYLFVVTPPGGTPPVSRDIVAPHNK